MKFLDIFSQWKINMTSLAKELWIGSNALSNKLYQDLDLTKEQKAKASEWLDKKIRLLVKCKVIVDKDLH